MLAALGCVSEIVKANGVVLVLGRGMVTSLTFTHGRLSARATVGAPMPSIKANSVVAPVAARASLRMKFRLLDRTSRRPDPTLSRDICGPIRPLISGWSAG